MHGARRTSSSEPFDRNECVRRGGAANVLRTVVVALPRVSMLEHERPIVVDSPRPTTVLDPAFGWWPYVNLVYLFFVFLPLFFYRDPAPRAWIASVVAVGVFLPIYFLGWRTERWRIPVLVATAALSYALIPFNPGGNSLLIYAISFAGYMQAPRNAIVVSIALVTLLALQIIWLGYPLAYVAITAVIGGMVLTGILLSRVEAQHNAELRLSQEEIKRLARAHERERIARDLHDLLGHTLSLIAVKAELARKLVERNAFGAASEIAGVERIARDALSQVRSAVADMRGAGFSETCDNVCAVLEGTGIEVERATALAIPLANDADQALAWVLRESVTNILRHASARSVAIGLRGDDQCVMLEIVDDGHGSEIVEGQGIRGMRERMAALGGELAIDAGPSQRTRVRASIPVSGTQERSVAGANRNAMAHPRDRRPGSESAR